MPLAARARPFSQVNRQDGKRPSKACDAEAAQAAERETDLAGGVRRLRGGGVPPGREHGGGLSAGPDAVSSSGRRGVRSRNDDPGSGRLRDLAPRQEFPAGHARPAPRFAQGLLPLPAARRRSAGQPGRVAGQPEALGAGAPGAQPRADRRAAGEPDGPTTRSGGAIGPCWNCSTPPAAGPRSCRT